MSSLDCLFFSVRWRFLWMRFSLFDAAFVTGVMICDAARVAFTAPSLWLVFGIVLLSHAVTTAMEAAQ